MKKLLAFLIIVAAGVLLFASHFLQKIPAKLKNTMRGIWKNSIQISSGYDFTIQIRDDKYTIESHSLARRKFPSTSSSYQKRLAWQVVEDGIAVSQFVVHREYKQTKEVIEIVLLKIDPSEIIFKLIGIEKNGFAWSAAQEHLKQSGASVCINAGYFDDSGPLGLVLSEGKTYQKNQQSVPGYFVSKHGSADILITRKFAPQNWLFGVQCSPVLLNNHKSYAYVHDGINTTTAERRSAVGILDDGKILFLATDTVVAGLTIQELAYLLGMFSAKKALNLDGGSSTQLAISVKDFKKDIPGFKKIPLSIGIFVN